MKTNLYTIDISKSRVNPKTKKPFTSRNKAVDSLQEEILLYLKNYNGELPEDLIGILEQCDNLKSISRLNTREIHVLFLYLEKILGLELTFEDTSERVYRLIELKRSNRWKYLCLVSPEEKFLELKMKYLGLKHYVWIELYERRKNLIIALWEDLCMLRDLKEFEAEYFFSHSDEQIITFISFLKKAGLSLKDNRLAEFSL